jgi:hypothetical protein
MSDRDNIPEVSSNKLAIGPTGLLRSNKPPDSNREAGLTGDQQPETSNQSEGTLSEQQAT